MHELLNSGRTSKFGADKFIHIVKYIQQCVRICHPDGTVPNRTVSMGHRLPYRTVFYFFPKSAISTVRSGKYYRFLVQKRGPCRCNLNTVFSFFFTAYRTVAKTRPFSVLWKKSANRTVTKTKAFSIFNFNREPCRNEIWSIYHFF